MGLQAWMDAIREMPVEETQRYVLGFAFDLHGRVAMIRKAKPEWQAGLFNGIGGKIEPGEEAAQAMSREFTEETGVHIEAEGWYHQGVMVGDDWIVEVFTVTSNKVAQCRTSETEEVYLFDADVAHVGAIENIQSLINLCRIPCGHSGAIPHFILRY